MQHNPVYEDDLQRHLFHVFTLVALTFLLAYAVLQAAAGYMGLAALYAIAAGIIAVNRWAIHFHKKLALAVNIFASLGPVVLLPWQMSGGIAGTGLMWFPAYVVFVMFFVPGKGGSLWVILTYSLSFILLLLQLQGTLPFPFQPDVMFHFYFVGGVTYALTILFLHAQRIIFDMQKMRIASLQKTAELSAAGDWYWDVATNTAHWSEQFYAIFDMDPAKQITLESYLESVHPEDRPLVKATALEALTDFQPFSVIYRFIRRDGNVIWVHSLGRVLRDAHGKPVKLFGTVQDISERMAKNVETSAFHYNLRRKGIKE